MGIGGGCHPCRRLEGIKCTALDLGPGQRCVALPPRKIGERRLGGKRRKMSERDRNVEANHIDIGRRAITIYHRACMSLLFSMSIVHGF